MTWIYLALAGRIFLVGLERIFVKKLQKYDSGVINFWWFFIWGNEGS